jgi:hypothetical protein
MGLPGTIVWEASAYAKLDGEASYVQYAVNSILRPALLDLDREVCSYCSANLGRFALFYIVQESRVLVGYNIEVLVGLHDSNVTRITWEEF